MNRQDVCTILIVLCASICASAQAVDGTVRTSDGKSVSHTTITVDEDISASAVTSNSGAFSLPLMGNLHLKMAIDLHIQGWIIVQPCDLKNGRVYLRDPLEGPINVETFRPGDPRLKEVIKMAPVFRCMIQEQAAQFVPKSQKGTSRTSKNWSAPGSINNDVVASTARRPGLNALASSHTTFAAYRLVSFGVDGHDVDESPDQANNGQAPGSTKEMFLKQKAAEFGFNAADFSTAFALWQSSATDNFSRSLIAFYERRYDDAIQLLTPFAEAKTIDGAKAYVLLGRCQYELGNYKVAETSLRNALSKLPGDVIILNDLGVVLGTQGKYVQAQQFLQQAVQSLQPLPDKSKADLALILGNLAVNLDRQSKYTDALAVCQQSLSINAKALGASNSQRVPLLNTLGSIYMDEKQFNAAFSAWNEAMDLAANLLASDDPMLANAAFNMGSFFKGAQRYAEAQHFFQTALATDEAHYGKDHPALIPELTELAHVKLDLIMQSGGTDYSEVGTLLIRARSIAERKLPPDDPEMVSILIAQAFVFDAKKEFANSEPLYRKALAIDEKLFGPQSPSLLSDLEYLAGAELDAQHYADAASTYQRAVALEESTHGEGPMLSDYLARLGLSLEKANTKENAITAYKRSINVGLKAWGPYSSQRPLLANVVDRLVSLLKDLNHRDEIPQYEKLAEDLRAGK